MANVTTRFRIDFTADFYDDRGQLRYQDVGLGCLLSEAGIEVGRFHEHRQEISAEQLTGVQGVVVLASRVTARSLERAQDLLAIARFGVGYDSVDVAACTAADVVLCIAAGAVDHSVAEATVGWMLSLTHHMSIKDRIVREGRWNDRDGYMGSELRDRTLGIIGFGGIGRAVARMLSGFRMQKPLVFDPALSREEIEAAGARAASLDELLSESDFVSLHCPLNDRTRNLIGARELSLMSRHAYLLNTARGGIIDEDALYQALKSKQIAGAALDCFVGEPLTQPSRFAELDNVILAPHSIAWTNELFRDIGNTACQSLVELAHGRRPRGVVNPEVFDRPTFQAKWGHLQLKK
jgi:phosphoglycerate dehydrogenase-like enzyme